MILNLVLCVYLVRINPGLLSFLSATYIHYFPLCLLEKAVGRIVA